MKSYRTNSTSTDASSNSAFTQYTAEDSNSAQLDELKDETEKERLARAQHVGTLPGAADGEAAQGLAVHNARMVEHKSDMKTHQADQSWHTMNEDYALGYTFEHAEKGTPASTPIHMGFEGESQRTKEDKYLDETGVHTIKDYRKMLRRDFNFSGAVNRFAGNTNGKQPIEVYNAGENGFLQATVDRFYPGKKVGDDSVKVCVELARNIWSYASMGRDCEGTTDVAELQGLLYVFDLQIRKSSDTNTKMAEGTSDDDYFILPGTEDWETPIKILKGDGRHGRATILTSRHLLGNMTEKAPETGLQGYDETYMAIDKSGSMQTDEFGKLSKMISAGGITGDVALAGFDSDPASLAKVDGGKPMHPAEARKLLHHTQGEVGSRRKKAATDKSINSHQGGMVNGAPELGDASGSKQHEEGLANALEWVKDIKGPKVKRQMVVVTDEPDFNPGVLAELKTEASKRSVDVKVLYSFAYDKNGKKVGGAKATHFTIISIDQIAKIEDAWLIDREDTQQLDWGKVSDDLGCKVHNWSSY